MGVRERNSARGMTLVADSTAFVHVYPSHEHANMCVCARAVGKGPQEGVELNEFQESCTLDPLIMSSFPPAGTFHCDTPES